VEQRNPKGDQTETICFTKVTVKYLFLHESGESIELMVTDMDRPTGQRGAATTYALKTVYYTAFNPVGKIDDTDLKTF
jgi:hypothetical protein